MRLQMQFRPCRSQSDAVRVSRTVICLLLVLVLAASATTTPILTADPNRYLADIKTLAAPNMEGRGPGTKGLERASKYIEHRYKELGLQPTAAPEAATCNTFTVTTWRKVEIGQCTGG